MIIIEGQDLICKICEKKVTREEAVFIPNVEANLNAPLAVLNGMVAHESCLMQHPLFDELNERYEELERLAKANQLDYITQEALDLEQLGHPDNLIQVFYLTDDPNHPLYKYNGIALNKNNLVRWKEFPYFLDQLNEFNQSGLWKGNALENLINRLKSPITKPYSKEFLNRMKQRYGK